VQRFPFSVRSSTPFAPAVISPDRSPPQFGTSEWPEPPDFVAATDSERDEAELSEDEKACYSFSKNFGPCKDCEDACLDTAACQSDTKRQHICHFCGGPHKGIWCVDDEKKAEFKARAKALKAKRQRTSKMPNGDHEHYWESDGWDGEGGWGEGDNASAWGSPVKPPSAKKGKGDDEKSSGKYGSKKGSDEKGSKKGEDKGSKGKGRGGKGRGKGERVEMSKGEFEGLLEAAAGKALEKAEAQRYAEGAAGEWPPDEEEEEKGDGWGTGGVDAWAGAADAWDSQYSKKQESPGWGDYSKPKPPKDDPKADWGPRTSGNWGSSSARPAPGKGRGKGAAASGKEPEKKDPKHYAKQWRLGEGDGGVLCKVCGYAVDKGTKVKIASRKTEFNSYPDWVTCGEHECSRELQSRVDLENTYTGTHNIAEMIGYNGHTWVENAKH